MRVQRICLQVFLAKENNLCINEYNRWLENVKDKQIFEELNAIKNDVEQIEDRFYRELSFSTGGLRGILGAGSNRMNIYTVGKATQGYSHYLNKNFDNPSVAMAYDSRINSELFAKVSAEIFAQNGIKVYIYSALMPTPAMSFAVRDIGCSGGIVITASVEKEIQDEINLVDVFNDVKKSPFE